IQDDDSWFRIRALKLELYAYSVRMNEYEHLKLNPLLDIKKEDIYCVNNLSLAENTTDRNCNQPQLMDITHSYQNAVQHGNSLDFYNTDYTIISLQKPEDIFINYL